MKKIIALLLALLMLVSLAACGAKDDGNEPADTKKTETDAKKDEGDAKPDVVTPLFSLDYDEEVWNLVEDEKYEEDDYCALNLRILDPEDPEYYLIDVEISVSIEDPYGFRSDLNITALISTITR